MSSRRDFVRLASTGLAGFVGLPAFRLESLAAGRPAGALGPAAIQPVGVQLYTLRSLMAEDVAGTLRAVAEIGYREVEFAGLFDTPPADVRTLLDELGLDAVSSHVSMDRIREQPAAVLDEAEALGLRYVTCPSIGRDELTPEGLPGLADDFNRFGEVSRHRGLGFAYHNHDFEFEEVAGFVPYDRLLEQCDADLVKMQLDVYWVTHAGRDPVAYLRAHPGRFPMIHVKDRTPAGEMVDVGDGTIDFSEILKAAEVAGLEHWLVEHDGPEDPLASIRRSYATVSALGG